MTNPNKKYRCPCCDYYTLEEGPGYFDICPVCYWEDDGFQADNPDYSSGANGISLNQAQENFKNFGAVEKIFLHSVRPPLPEEMVAPEKEKSDDKS